MSKVKGCVNAGCTANQKKRTFPETEAFCSQCGQPLAYVCKKCYTPVNAHQTYCLRCQAERNDRADKAKKTAANVGVAAAGLVAFVTKYGAKAVEAIQKTKK